MHSHGSKNITEKVESNHVIQERKGGYEKMRW
jgi:hypothetical protein